MIQAVRFSALLLLLLPSLVPMASAQPLQPQDGPLFNRSVLPTVRITLPPDSLVWLLDDANQQNDRELRADFAWLVGTSVTAVSNVGFRLRGNTSRAAAKKSWKVSFNSFTSGGSFQGVEKLNLNGEHNDPTLMRSALAWSLVRDARLPGSRSNFVRLEINGADFGVYANVEHVDENFLAVQFRDASGALYKCLYPADLADLGNNPATYRDLAPFGRPVYELAQGSSDHSDLVQLIAVLNRTPSNTLPVELEKVLDVNGYLRALAVDVLSGNWDGYAYNQNNYYLYNDPDIGVFRYIPYDLDNLLGVDFLGRDWGTRNVYDWPQGSNTGNPPRPLAKRLLVNADYRARFSFYVNRLLQSSFRTDSLDARIARIRSVIDDAVAVDPYRPLDYGWTVGDYENAFNTALGGHVAYGLRPFVSTRRSTALSQLTVTDIAPLISERRIEPRRPGPGEVISVRAWVEDEAVPATVHLFYRIGGGAFSQALAMAPDTAGVYSATIGPFAAGDVVDYFIEATDVGGRTRIEPRLGSSDPASFTVSSPVTVGLVINELMASNSTTIADEAGEFDDWIEIFNTSSAPISLAGLFITDAMSAPDKFALPDTTVAPGGHVIVWADDDSEQGPMHATFKLGAGGEDAALFGPDGQGGLAMIDGITFGPQTTDISFGRQSDGAEPFVFQTLPTPGAPNVGAVASGMVAAAGNPSFTVAPNPVRGSRLSLYVGVPSASELHIRVYDSLGRLVLDHPPTNVSSGLQIVDIAHDLGSGLYVMVASFSSPDGDTQTQSRRFTVLR